MISRQPLAYFRLIVILSLTILSRSFAQDTIQMNAIFFQANHFYKTEQYPQAINAYEQLIAAGITSGHLFYNLGNAYIKTGSTGKAILNYERALQHLPRDADVKANLEYARSLVEGDTIKRSDDRLLSWTFFLEHYANLNELAVMVSLLYVGLMVLLILSILIRNFRRASYYGMAAVGILLLFSSICFGLRLHKTQFQYKAVVMSEALEARFEPSDDATSHFTLHEGMVIEITEYQAEWSRIRRWDGKSGWLKNDVFEGLSARE